MTWEMKMETEPNQLEEKEERVLAALCHLAAFAGFFLPFVGHILGPLVVWLLKRDTSAFIDEHGKESLNFQLSITLYSVVALLLVVFLIGFVLILGLLILDAVMVVVAAVHAGEGLSYRYPFTIRFIK